MNITFSSREFLKELEPLSRIIDSKPTNPILANVLLQAADGGIRMSSTNLVLGLLAYCSATVDEPGVTTLPAKHLLEIIKLLPDRDVTMIAEKDAVKVVSGKYTARIPTYPASEYPTFPSAKGLQRLTLPPTLRDMVRRVRFAISDKGKKYYMDGALLSGTSLVSTDGLRLAVTSCADCGVAEPVIIPSKALDALFGMLTESTSEVLFSVSDRHLFFVVDGTLLISRRVEGTFPAYQRIIPQDTTVKAVISRLALHEAVRRVSVTSEELVFRFTRDVLTLTGKSMDIGDAFEQIDIQFPHDDITFKLNGNLVQEFLAEAGSPMLTITWKGAGAIMFLDGDDYAYIQMPLSNAGSAAAQAS